MQCSISLERDRVSGNKMKTLNHYKNPYRKEYNLNTPVDHLSTRLQDLQDRKSASQVGMPTCNLEHTEAVRRYYAAFPALNKGQESPLQYYLPPPAWCRKTAPDNSKMQSEVPISKDWKPKNKKFSLGKSKSESKERRNSYHGQKRNRKHSNSYCRSFENKESLPEWVTYEGVWDIETHDPVKDFVLDIALDEGYGTCENTVTDEIKEITQVKIKMNENIVPDWDDGFDLEVSRSMNQLDWVITEDLKPRVLTPMEEELYAKFEAKFDRSIEALWSKDQNTPDDEYQDLPIDFQDLLSSPSDHLFADPSAEKCSLISLTESIWSNDGFPPAERTESPSKIVDVLHDRFKPLNLTDAAEPPPCPPREIESFSLYEGEEIYDAVATVAETMRSFTAINHSRDRSGFAEVPPRRRCGARPPGGAARCGGGGGGGEPRAEREHEDLLTSARTHFRPIRREHDEPPRYADGDSFDIRGDLDPVEFHRSESGGVYLLGSRERYLEYRAAKTVDYGRLNLTAAQRCPDLDDPAFRLRFPLRQTDAAVQTEPPERACACAAAAKKMRTVRGAPCACAPAAAPKQPAAVAAEAAGAALAAALQSAERKRRHSAARSAACAHPQARFLHCCALLDRPLTR